MTHHRRLRVAHAQRARRAVGPRHRPASPRSSTPAGTRASLKWRVLPRNPSTMAQSVTYIDTSHRPAQLRLQRHAGLHLHRRPQGRDHRPHRRRGQGLPARARLRGRASSSSPPATSASWRDQRGGRRGAVPDADVGVRAIIALCLVTFRSVAATLCIVIPLGLVSILAYALMACSRSASRSRPCRWSRSASASASTTASTSSAASRANGRSGQSLAGGLPRHADITGNGVVFTGITLAVGVGTWIFSPLKFQADMGILLTFMFLVNMLGAIILLCLTGAPSSTRRA
jgi:uncharacterized protein